MKWWWGFNKLTHTHTKPKAHPLACSLHPGWQDSSTHTHNHVGDGSVRTGWQIKPILGTSHRLVGTLNWNQYKTIICVYWCMRACGVVIPSETLRVTPKHILTTTPRAPLPQHYCSPRGRTQAKTHTCLSHTQSQTSNDLPSIHMQTNHTQRRRIW